MASLVLVTGFGPFPEVPRNCSGPLALALQDRPPPGIEVVARVLPASFRRAPEAYDELLETLGGRRPCLLLALGVHRKAGFRLERRARRGLTGTKRLDVDGTVAREVSEEGPPLDTPLDLEGVARTMARSESAETFSVSDDAGDYVCERTYRHALERAGDLGIPGMFVHVPKERFTPLPRQREVLARLVSVVLD